MWDWVDDIVQKFNPAQRRIVEDQGEYHEAPSISSTSRAYNSVEVVNRAVNLIVDTVASISYDVGRKQSASLNHNLSKTDINKLINSSPNPYQDANSFLRMFILDLIVEGDGILYFDGANLFVLPSKNVTIVADSKTYINKYTYQDNAFYPNEIIHVKENSVTSIYRGTSRLTSCLSSISLLDSMSQFQTRFFENNAIPGLVIKSANNLSPKYKEKFLEEWRLKFNPKSGGKRPMILDADMSIESLGHTDRRELDFNDTIKMIESKILKALGVPSVLLDSGNNANITPNQRMFILNTVLPIADRVASALEYFFGYDIKPVKENIIGLQPDLSEQSTYYTSLVNAGILTRNEVREQLRWPKSSDAVADRLVLPANIAGSNLPGTSEPGGAPPIKKE